MRLPQNGEHFTEDGHLEKSVEFDYDSVDRSVYHPGQEDSEITNEELKKIAQLAGARVSSAISRWIVQSGMNDPQGVMIRSVVYVWATSELLRPLTLSELARGFGMKKQSFGRWVDQWKKDFPTLRNTHMKNE